MTEIPDGADYASAAAFGVTYRTAYHALRSIADVAAGDWVVVLGAAGGVGLAAVDLAVAMKARVLAAASSPEKLELCRQRGAEATVDYDREDLKTRIRELTGDAARVVLDPVGGRYAEPALRALARGGTFVTLGYAAGAIPSIPLNLVLLKGITVRGMEIRTFVSDRPDDSARDMRELTQMFADGRRSGPTSARGSRWPTPRRRCGMSPTARRSAKWSSTSGVIWRNAPGREFRADRSPRRGLAWRCDHRHGVTMLNDGSGRSSTPSNCCSAAWSPEISSPGEAKSPIAAMSRRKALSSLMVTAAVAGSAGTRRCTSTPLRSASR